MKVCEGIAGQRLELWVCYNDKAIIYEKSPTDSGTFLIPILIADFQNRLGRSNNQIAILDLIFSKSFSVRVITFRSLIEK